MFNFFACKSRYQRTLNGLTKRYDIVVYKEAKPWMVMECKAPHIPLTQEVLEQAGRYNQTLNAEIIGITNGVEQKFFKVDFNTESSSFALAPNHLSKS
jgi:hypothetical protein